MKTLVFLITCLIASAEPAELAEKRKIYLRELQKLEVAHQQKVKALTWKYIHGLNKLKVIYTKAGKLEMALAVRAEVDELKGAPASGKKPTISSASAGRRIRKVVIHQTTNGSFKNAGVKSGKILWYYGTRKMAGRNFKKFKLDWIPGKNTHVEIRVSATQPITKLRIECDASDLPYVALAEVEVFDHAGHNISADAKLEVSSTYRATKHQRAYLIDGVTTADLSVNWSVSRDGKGKPGWIEMTWE